MTKSSDVDAALEVLDRALTPAPELARERVAKFKLDREKGEKVLPVTNIHDDKGAPVLDRDAVLRKSYPNHADKA